MFMEKFLPRLFRETENTVSPKHSAAGKSTPERDCRDCELIAILRVLASGS
jgi:hypothetical protein